MFDHRTCFRSLYNAVLYINVSEVFGLLNIYRVYLHIHIQSKISFYILNILINVNLNYFINHISLSETRKSVHTE